VSGAPGTGALHEAFLRFESAASNLEERHAALLVKAERLERELVDSNRRLEAVLDALGSGVAVVSRHGDLIRTNEAFRRLGFTGSGGDLRETALGDLLLSADGTGGAARMTRDTDGGPRELAVTLIPVGDQHGTQVIHVQDVTEIRREEEEGGRRRRLEALGRMAAEVAHEVRNPLGSIRLFASMLCDDLADREGPRGMAEQILAAVSGLESTVSNLLSFASPPRGESRAVDLASLGRDVQSLLAPACTVRGVTLEGPAENRSCPVWADPEAMRQVLLNLVGNALAATEGGGRIRISAEPSSDGAVLTVEDEGRGIEAEDLPRVFDPFFTRTDGGSGLGLSIVHGIVERHRGRIALDSRPGRGTRVRVELPGAGERPGACDAGNSWKEHHG
jgi:signal transduction histidine kinase